MRHQLAALYHAVALLAAIVLIVMTAPSAHWNAWELAIITGLTIGSELTSVNSGRVQISGSFLGLMLAAVLLGGGPAALVGVVTITLGWLRTHEPGHLLRNNLVTYTWFPLLSGLLFHAIVHQAHIGTHQAAYYLVVFGAFVFALLLNIVMVLAYQCFLDEKPFWPKVASVLKPILAPELFSDLLTLMAVYLAIHLGAIGLALFALVLILFQYLIGELLTSQRRGEELQLLATTDELTGLANRKSFSDRVEREIKECKERGESFGVLLLDLDRFKEINDTLGHQYGDLLLTELGPRLAARVGPDGLVARLGGDEFAILTGNRGNQTEELERAANDLMACAHEPIMIEDITLEAGSSVGIARYPQDGDDVQTLMRRADVAMYAAKEHRDSYRFYDSNFDHHSTQRLGMLGDFRRGLDLDEIVVHYQPIVDLRSRTVSGAEGLVRWQHPKLGLLQPGAFLQVVEQTGLMGPLTRTVLNSAIGQCAEWHRSGLDMMISVNLSVRNLLDPTLPTEIERLLSLYGLPSEALRLEITESMIMSDPERVLGTVHDLSALGLRLAVDDFGTGHSSLANLRRMPIDELKIDRSFVTPMLSDESDLIIVRSTINLGHDLGLKIVAEGVEDQSTLDSLDGLGCDLAQGYHLSKPISSEKFTDWVTDFQGPAPTVDEPHGAPVNGSHAAPVNGSHAAPVNGSGVRSLEPSRNRV